MRHICLLFIFTFLVTSLYADEALTNRDVIEMVKAGLGDDLIKDKVANSESIFDMSTSAMIDLKKNKVPDALISLMHQEYLKTQKKRRAKIAVEIQNLAAQNEEMRRTAFNFLKRIDTAALPQLRSVLAGTSPSLRAASADALGRLGDKGSVSMLRELLSDKEENVRLAAADALALLDDEAALQMSRQAVSTGGKNLDGYLRLLGRFRDLKSTEFISVRLMKDSDMKTRQQAAWALGEIKSENGLMALEEALVNERDMDVKKEAALALGKITNEKSFDKLASVCRKHPQIRVYVIEAIGYYPAERSVPFLISALGQSLKPEEKTAALKALRKHTNRDLGSDVEAWNAWLEENRNSLSPKNNEIKKQG